MRIGIVTVSFNQARWLAEAVASVAVKPPHELCYVIVDPGSEDGSRDIIHKHANLFHRIILEPDQGAGDGLNKGFAACEADVLGFLNADDYFLPNALNEALDYLHSYPNVDVVAGHCLIVDGDGQVLRRSYSDRPAARRVAYGAAVLIQPSVFFRNRAWRLTKGFNVQNRSNWDGELFLDMLLAGARFAVVDRFWSAYRVHAASTTGSGSTYDLIQAYQQRVFERIMGRPWRTSDRAVGLVHQCIKHVLEPRNLVEHLRHGPVYRRTCT